MRRLLLLAPLALLVAACGQTVAVKPFLPGPTASCLRAAGFDVSTTTGVPLVISTAANGGLIARPKNGNALAIAFAADASGAADVERAIHRVAPKKLRPHLGDILSSKRNAVLLWTISPLPGQQQTALGCLRS